MSELENSLTDIGWLKQKLTSTKYPRGALGDPDTYSDPKGTPERNILAAACQQNISKQKERIHFNKPATSYAKLIIRAIQSTPSRTMTLNEIYNWISNSYPYFKITENSWKNSIRHNLSLNRCFVRLSRPKEDPGKGSYWTIDKEFMDEGGSLKVKSKTRLANHGRLSPYSSTSSPTSLPDMELSPVSCLRPAQSQPLNQGLSPVEINDGQLKSVIINGQTLLLLQQQNQLQSNHLMDADDCQTAHNSCDIMINDQDMCSKPTASNLNNSLRRLYEFAFEDPNAEVLSSHYIKNYESLKVAVKLASATNWCNFDLSKFPDLAESFKAANSSNWSLDQDQLLDLAASLNSFYDSADWKHSDNTDVFTSDHFGDPLISGSSLSSTKETQGATAFTSSGNATPHTIDQNGAGLADGADDCDIEDDFNWDLLLLS